MATKTQIQTPHKTPVCIRVTKNGARIRYDDGIEIPVSMTWTKQYVEYMLATNQEIIVEVVP
jgi:hypothetical protein